MVNDVSLNRRKSGVVLSYVYSLAQVVVNLIYVPLLLRTIGKDEYGLYQLIGSIMAYMTIMNSTFSGGATRFYCKYFSEGNTRMMENTLAVCRRIYQIVSVAAIVIGALVCVAFRWVYARSLTGPQLDECIVMLATLVANLIVTMNNTISVAVINTHERFVFLKITQLFTVVAQPALILLSVSFLPYAFVIPIIQLFLNLICAFVQRIFARQILGAKIKMHDKCHDLFKSILAFASGILFVTLADQILWKTNQLVLGFYYGSEVVAIYGVASQIYMAYMPIGTAIASVFMPKISVLYHKKHDLNEISKLFAKVGRISLYPLLLVLLGFIAFGRDFISLWAGDGYEDAYLVAVLIMVPFTIDLAQNLSVTIMQVMNKYAFRGKMLLVISVINLICVMTVSPVYGSVGAATCTSVAMILGYGLIMNLYLAKRLRLDIKGFWENAIRVALPLVLYGLGVMILSCCKIGELTSWYQLAIAVLLFTVGYLLVAWLFCFNANEKEMARNVISKIK